MPPIETYFNSTCPVCNTEIGRCRTVAQDVGSDMAWHDINRDPAALARFGVDLEDVRRRLHVIDRDGRLLVGVPAFAALWRELPGHRWLAKLAMAPLLLPVWTVLYDALAWALYKWNRWRQRRHPGLAAPRP
jgi:predicted DCC family thiol-disulfide oxidoreductase YuxK